MTPLTSSTRREDAEVLGVSTSSLDHARSNVKRHSKKPSFPSPNSKRDKYRRPVLCPLRDQPCSAVGALDRHVDALRSIPDVAMFARARNILQGYGLPTLWKHVESRISTFFFSALAYSTRFQSGIDSSYVVPSLTCCGTRVGRDAAKDELFVSRVQRARHSIFVFEAECSRECDKFPFVVPSRCQKNNFPLVDS